MGLDMYAYFGKDIKDIEDPDSEIEEDYYWRSRHGLNNWFKFHAWNPQHPGEDMDCSAIELTRDILEDLQKEIRGASEALVPVYEDDAVLIYRKNVPITSEIYTYVDDPIGEMNYDLKFVEKALKAVDEGKKIYYLASW